LRHLPLFPSSLRFFSRVLICLRSKAPEANIGRLLGHPRTVILCLLFSDLILIKGVALCLLGCFRNLIPFGVLGFLRGLIRFDCCFFLDLTGHSPGFLESQYSGLFLVGPHILDLALFWSCFPPSHFFVSRISGFLRDFPCASPAFNGTSIPGRNSG